MKRFFRFFSLALVLALSLSVLCSCGGGTEDSSSAEPSATETASLSCSVSELKDELFALSAAGKDNMLESGEGAILDNTGISKALYEEGFYASDVGGVSIETLMFFKAVDEASATAIKEMLEAKNAEYVAQSKNYNEDNYEMANNGVVEQVGVYVYMIISPKVSEMTAAISAKF